MGFGGSSGGSKTLSTIGNNNLMQADNLVNQGSSLLGQGPVMTLPSSMVSNVSLGNYPSFLGYGSKKNPNPLFSTPSTKIAADYGNKLFNAYEVPQLGAAAEQQWLGGNEGNSGQSSFGADYMSNLDASAQQNSFLGGQQYYDDLLNNFMNERQNYYGTQLQPELQAQEFNQQQNLAGLGLLNNFNLDAAGAYGNLAGVDTGIANSAYGQNNALWQQKFQNSMGQAMSLGNLAGGVGGLAGGLLGLGTGGGNTIGGNIAGGISNMFSGTPAAGSSGGFAPLVQDPNFNPSGGF